MFKSQQKTIRRFPRPRGDGPPSAFSRNRPHMVPPPTRGWSPGGIDHAPRSQGSPAHAGMVPNDTDSHYRADWFPRPRGDGPHDRNPQSKLRRVPPPTRGWSGVAFSATAPILGSPAHAGMVPRVYPLGGNANRFPRPRGDGPDPEHAHLVRIAVPPPTRGWSFYEFARSQFRWGSPAHAGMVPTAVAEGTTWTWFPRPRGDGPRMTLVRAEVGAVPPPTRGWSSCIIQRAPRRYGSPAHAGMVRPVSARSARGVGFPRPRGDGPRVDCPRTP